MCIKFLCRIQIIHVDVETRTLVGGINNGQMTRSSLTTETLDWTEEEEPRHIDAPAYHTVQVSAREQAITMDQGTDTKERTGRV